MTNLNQKSQILESLNALDQAQTNQVMAYINALLYADKDTTDHQQLKRAALREIRQALSKRPRVKIAF